MALVICPDCNREISDTATACPGCGRPAAAPQPPDPNRFRRKGSQTMKATIGAVIGVLLGAFLGSEILSSLHERLVLYTWREMRLADALQSPYAVKVVLSAGTMAVIFAWIGRTKV